MAHYTKINRESLTTTLEDRYLTKQPAGGAFDAYRSSTFNTMLDAGNGSIQSILLTINPGIQPVGPYPNIPKENFNEKALNYIDDHGFNNKKYTDRKRR